MNDKTTIIAEVGVNHNGDIAIAKELIRLSAHAGVDIVKFQTFKAERLVTKRALKADYQRAIGEKEESQHDMLQKLELTDEMHQELIDLCAQENVEFMSTGFDIQSVDYLMSLGQKKIKIPSGEITNLPYLRNIARYQRPVIMSTGMSTTAEIDAAINALIIAGQPQMLISILHCTTAYPTPMTDVNLRTMRSLGLRFKIPFGYSDHTEGIEVAIAAVALGATVIEKHITMGRGLRGPDHRASIEPDELISMVRAIRNIELALGDGEKKLAESELGNRNAARQSVVASKAIKRGEVFSADNIGTKRPGDGLSPMLWDQIIGQVASREYDSDEQIEI